MEVHFSRQQVSKVVHILPLRGLGDPAQLVVIETLHCEPIQGSLSAVEGNNTS